VAAFFETKFSGARRASRHLQVSWAEQQQGSAMMIRMLCIAALASLSATLAPLSASAAGASDSDAAALLAKHRAYAGWAAGDGAIKTLRETGEGRRDGKVTVTLAGLRKGAAFRSSIQEEIGEFEIGFTGRVFWQSNENGFTIQTLGDPVKYLITELALENEELTALPGTIQRQATVGGVRTTVVRVIPGPGLPIDLYIDPQTGAYARYVIDPNGKYETSVDVLDFTDVGGGKRVISSWRYTGGKTVYTYTKIEANGEVTDAELHPPTQTASWTFGPPTETVPIEVTDTRIFVNAVVNGHPGRFVFDTGADGIAFTDSFARSVGAKRIGATEISGIGGGARANVYRVDTVALGSSTLHNVIIATGLDESLRDDEHYDGFVGFDLLAGAIVDVNLDEKTMRILDPAKVAPDHTQGLTAHVDLSTGQPRVPMTVAGHVPVLGTLDSGNTFYVLFSNELIQRDHVGFFQDPSSALDRVQFFGVNGTESDPCGNLQSLELGPIVYRPVPACASESFSHNDVLLGFNFVKAFNYVFDYPDGEILMTPRK
jgi:predicted aspartyl protease